MFVQLAQLGTLQMKHVPLENGTKLKGERHEEQVPLTFNPAHGNRQRTQVELLSIYPFPQVAQTLLSEQVIQLSTLQAKQ